MQFNHRLMGYLLFALGIAHWLRARSSALISIRKAFFGVTHVMLLQVVLGIATVLTAATWHVAILHQIGAIAVFVMVIRARFTALYPAQQRIKRGLSGLSTKPAPFYRARPGEKSCRPSYRFGTSARPTPPVSRR